MFFAKILYPTQKNPFTVKYIFKKKLYSFLYPNEVRNSLLTKKKNFIFYKLIFNKKLTNTTDGYYSTRKLKKLFNYTSLKLILSKESKIFSKKNTQIFTHQTKELNEIYDHDNFNFRGTDDSFKLSEVKIPRIQFKPGYQRM
jgi:hypothetical protein